VSADSVFVKGAEKILAGISSIFDELRGSFVQAVVACRAEPSVKAVHAVRTGTRRLEALLQKVAEDHAQAKGLRRALKGAFKQLGRVRKAAGAVRDLDVQMKLAEEVADELLLRKRGAVRDAITEEYERLDRYLRRRRKKRGADLDAELEESELKLERSLERIADEIAGLTSQGPSLLESARRWTRETAEKMGELNEANLHEYRKRTKAARYVAEEQEGSAVARRFAAGLRRVQDVIGEWHDWALLNELAAEVLGGDAAVTEALVVRRSRSLRTALRVQRR
jgi:CHAD domain-containing protein